MFTLIAWSESQDSAVLVNTAALADPHVRVSGDDIIVPRGMNRLIGLHAHGVNITLAQLQSPSLRRFVQYQIHPVDVAAEPGSPATALWLADQDVMLDEDEVLNALMAEDAAGASRVTICAWLGDAAPRPVGGDLRTVRATSATAAVANAWTNVAIAFDQALPAGRYAVVGAAMVAANGELFRFVFPGYAWRPGGLGSDVNGDVPAPGQRNGGWGVWGEFDHNTPPTVDILCNAADASQVFYLDLLKTA